jgi:hypothetical protein
MLRRIDILHMDYTWLIMAGRGLGESSDAAKRITDQNRVIGKASGTWKLVSIMREEMVYLSFEYIVQSMKRWRMRGSYLIKEGEQWSDGTM